MSDVQLLVLAGPSCVGKDTLLGKLLDERPELRKPVTTTTRPAREYEVPGVHYHFRTEEEFLRGIEQEEFVEHARVHGNLYGLTWNALTAVREAGAFPAVILDVQGVAAVRTRIETVTVFVRAAQEHLEQRIRRHRPIDEVSGRMDAVRRELRQATLFDYVIDNDEGRQQEAMAALLDIYDARVRPHIRWPGRRPDVGRTPAAGRAR